jgi:hypothetical protein
MLSHVVESNPLVRRRCRFRKRYVPLACDFFALSIPTYITMIPFFVIVIIDAIKDMR